MVSQSSSNHGASVVEGAKSSSASSSSSSGSVATTVAFDSRNIDQPSTALQPVSVESLPFKQFVWGAGMECSFLPHLNVDQYDWTQHNTFWRDDLRRAREELGITHLRYAFPWHKLEAQPGRFDWSYSDERMEELDKLGFNLLLDVMHFGTPLWLKQAVGDPQFPESLERFAHALVNRYRGSVKVWCPFNEPLVSALFSGDFGFWPPHSRKWHGYMPVLSRIVQGVNRGIRAIRSEMPEATVLLCDAAEVYKSRSKELAAEVARRNMRRFLVMDLLTGKVDKYHPLYPWLTGYGMSDLDLEWFRSNPQSPDVLGLDYYPHSDWQLELYNGNVRQRRADNPAGLYAVASAYWNRYGVPLMLTETSIEGQPINREIWLEQCVEHIKRLREEGIPMLGLIWWPLLDQIDWDGALLHRVGKVHEVGLFNLKRTHDGTLERKSTPLIKLFKQYVDGGEEAVGSLGEISYPSPEATDEQLPPIGDWMQPALVTDQAVLAQLTTQIGTNLKNLSAGKTAGNGNGKGNGNTAAAALNLANLLQAPVKGRLADPAPGLGAELGAAATEQIEKYTEGPNTATAPAPASTSGAARSERRDTDRYGIVVFSHLRWGFVWQRPQQFLSRFAKKHPILFIEEPFFDLKEGQPPDIQYHRVMPNVTVMCPHLAPSWNRHPDLIGKLREWSHQAIEHMNEDSDGIFDRPLLWYYSPMDSAWSLGHFENRGIVYDCMDELSQFTGAPKQLVAMEARLMENADIVFTGGYELGEKKRKEHDNVHTFGCGVEFEHFNKCADAGTMIPPDIDFMARPILGWFGVVDERVDYAMVGEMARTKPEWSFAMVGPVVKVDPNLLPHSPNLFWMGGRDYQQLPNYVAAFDICMMPFAMNASTQYINPTKGLEYMATGKPIISTPVRDVVRQWSDIVHIVRNGDEFVGCADHVLKHRDHARLNKGLELARNSSWENTVKNMQNLIKEAIGKPERRSSRRITPLTEAELSYQYQHTQGS